MDTWFWESEKEIEPPAQAALLQKLGFPGMALTWGSKHAERMAALKAAGLRSPGCYVTADIDGPYPEHLRQCVELMKGSGGLVWLALTSRSRKSSQAGGDASALALISRCADDCRASGVPGVALYPHVGFWMEKVGDAVRLAGRANRPDVGVQFNQYHWMTADRGQDLKATLAAARPFLKGVSINGSGVVPSILPLGEGGYDVRPILQELAAIGYAGPVSHQGYSIKGDVPRRLAAAKQAWETIAKDVRGT